jgi:OHCU decarboxylase
VLPDAVQIFTVDPVDPVHTGGPGDAGGIGGGAPVVDEVRLAVHPDGGLSRFRVHGELSRAGTEALRARRLDTWAADDVAAELHTCLASPSWAAAVVAGRPHGTGTAWLAAADRAYAALGDDEVARALAAHPRIGQAPTGAGREAGLSRGEQAAVTAADDAVKAEIAAGNAAYEERFGRVFLIRAAGRSPARILDALRRRLTQDDAAELAEAREQLRQITLLRLAGLLHAEPPPFGAGGEAA